MFAQRTLIAVAVCCVFTFAGAYACFSVNEEQCGTIRLCQDVCISNPQMHCRYEEEVFQTYPITKCKTVIAGALQCNPVGSVDEWACFDFTACKSAGSLPCFTNPFMYRCERDDDEVDTSWRKIATLSGTCS